MPQANKLRDLLRIRNANHDRLDKVNEYLGSAVGKKRSRDPDAEYNGAPCIIVFVPRKINATWLYDDSVIPEFLEGPDDLWCPVDVVEGAKADDEYFKLYDSYGENERLQSVIEMRARKPLSAGNLALWDQLKGWRDRLGPGSQIAATGVDPNDSLTGTLGCLVRDKASGELGLLTNKHVALQEGTVLYHPELDTTQIAITRRTAEYISDMDRFPGITNENGAYFIIDCAFASLDSSMTAEYLDARLPYLSKVDDTLEQRGIGSSLPIDLDSMDLIDMPVIGVGATRSFQRGKIVAFAYEYEDYDETGHSGYTDFLIVGDDGSEFSDPGDSGKLIFTDEETPRPVGLLWGGWYERLRSSKLQENWTYAIDINIVLEKLNIEIVSVV